jgi:hypothetical protein
VKNMNNVKSPSQRHRAPRQRRLSPAALTGAIAGTVLIASAASASIITVRSGQVGGFPGVPGQIDSTVRCIGIINPNSQPAYTPSTFAGQNSWPNPTIITPSFVWTPTLGALDPQARWINIDFMQDWYGYPISGLYSVPFFVPGSGAVPATLTLKLAVDDSLGDWSTVGNNPAGVYLNGAPLTPNYTAANYGTPTTYTKAVTLNGGTTNYLQLYQRDIGASVAGIIFSADFNVPNSSGCLPKPSGMSLWLPFDETTGTGSLNTVDATHPGVRFNGPVPAVSQLVANSLTFDGVNDYVNVSTSTAYPGIDPGQGSFTIDMWVKKASVDNTVQVLVDHRVENSGPVLGYSYFLGGANNQALQLGDSSGFTNWPGGPATAIPGDNRWHLAAVVVNRGPSVSNPTATFYVDGVAVGTPVNISAHPGNINPPAGTPFRVGARSSSNTGNFAGGIDEVEFFGRALSALEIRNIYTAGIAGKCKNEVKAPVTSYCRTTTIQPTNLYICNYTNAPASYTWNLSTLGVGPGCTVPGPTGFSPSSGSVLNVPAGQCQMVTVNIAVPINQPNYSTACYQFTATNTGTGETTSTTGKLSRWCIFPDPTGVVLASTVRHDIPMTVLNETSDPITMKYRIRVLENDLDADGVDDVSGAIRLNGLPPGEPVLGTLVVEPGTVGGLPLDVSFDAPDGSSVYTVLIEGDTSGGTDYQALRTYFVSFGEEQCRADFNGDGVSDFFDYLDFVAAFDAEDLAADFNGDGVVDFFDYLDFASAFDAGCE